jgi:hypothetical protein
MHRIANPCRSVRLRPAPPVFSFVNQCFSPVRGFLLCFRSCFSYAFRQTQFNCLRCELSSYRVLRPAVTCRRSTPCATKSLMSQRAESDEYLPMATHFVLDNLLSKPSSMRLRTLSCSALSGVPAVNLITAKNAVNIQTITAMIASANHFAFFAAAAFFEAGFTGFIGGSAMASRLPSGSHAVPQGPRAVRVAICSRMAPINAAAAA